MRTFTKEPCKRSPQLVQSICAVYASLCASDVSDSQTTSTGYEAIVQHHQPQVCLCFSGECGNAGFSVASPLPRVQCVTEALHGSLCFIKGQSAPRALCLFMCPFSTRRHAHSGLRETLAFELLSRHCLLSENRERRGEF